jgi:hypothetical protein
MIRSLLTLIIFFPSISFGQKINDSLLASLYNKTLTYYFSETGILKGQSKFMYVLVKTDFDTSKLIKRVGANRFRFYSSKTTEQSVLDEPLMNNKGRNIYSIYHQAYKKDSIDMNIGGWTIESISKKSISLAAWCGGTLGYIPDARFIYSKTNNAWIFKSDKELMNTKISGRMNK